jgi:hypothetical protein
MPVKSRTLLFDDDGYPGFECERRLNLPLGAHRIARSAKTEEDRREFFLQMFSSWNFVDEDGEEIPHTVEGFDKIPDDLWEAMLTRGTEAVKEAAMPKNLDSSSSAEGDEPDPKTPKDGQDT